MKIRTGFVSNSSSSSFIVGIAEIMDKAKFDEYINKHRIKLDNDVFITTETSDKHEWDISVHDDNITVENFCASVSAKRKHPETEYFVVNISNDEGDNSFWNNEYCEMNYDIDIDYFYEDQQKVYEMFSNKDSGLNMDSNVTYGAERNG